MSIRVDFSRAGRELARQFENDSIQIETQIDKALLAGAQRVQAKAKSLVPVDTGHLKQSIAIRQTKQRGKTVMEVGTSAEHSVFVEYGTGIYAEEGNGRRTPWVYKDPKSGKFYLTKGVKPHPYLRPAYYQNAEYIQKMILKGLRGELQ